MKPLYDMAASALVWMAHLAPMRSRIVAFRRKGGIRPGPGPGPVNQYRIERMKPGKSVSRYRGSNRHSGGIWLVRGAR